MAGVRARVLGSTLAAFACLSACNDDTAAESSHHEGYTFATADPSTYTRVDRHGMPAVNTAVILDRQAYNEADPASDASDTFVAQITASIEGLHAALDDDIIAVGLVPCVPSACVTRALPLVVPDSLKLDLSAVPGFPNGRLPSDPVIDVTLSVLLLDLDAEGQDATTLVGVLNPAANDLPFGTTFPYLAHAHHL